MRVPLSWIKEFVHIDERPEEISDRLTMLGLEVESIENLDGDVIFDVSITPNRPDCLSVAGISREIAIGFRREFRLPSIKRGIRPSLSGEVIVRNPSFRIIIDDPQLSGRYTARIIKDLRVGESPQWLRRRLEQCGLRSINNVVDITNYVMLGYGHPLHAFDLNTLRGRIIRVATAGKNQRIKTLDGVEREVPEDTLLIWDGERPVAIAGIMGGMETEVRPDTTDILLEAAHFLPSSIRRSSKRLGLRTEASYRFERGTDIEGLAYCADIATELILEICGGELVEVIDEYPSRFVESEIRLRSERVKRIIGEVKEDEIAEILNLLGFPFRKEDGIFIVKTLSRRPDIKAEIDLIEEIARIRGYEKIPLEMPRVAMVSAMDMGKGMRVLRDLELIKSILRARGFSEAINFSFMDIEKLKRLGILEGDRRLEAVEIRNPLRKEEAFLRTNLLISLLEDLITNIRYGIKDVMLFEISRVFFKRSGQLPDERLHLGVIYWRDRRPVLWKDELHPYYLLREIMDGLFHEFRINSNLYKASEEPFLHPYQSADIYISDKKIGYLGILSPPTCDRFDIRTDSPVAVLEIDLDTLLNERGSLPTFMALPRFPYIERDLAIIVDTSLEAERLRRIVLEYPSELIESVSVFDYFKGKNIPEGKKSIGLRIRYRSKDRTLTEEEIEDLHQRIMELLTTKTGGLIRK